MNYDQKKGRGSNWAIWLLTTNPLKTGVKWGLIGTYYTNLKTYFQGLGLFRLCLYSHIFIVFWQKVQLVFCLPFNCLTCDQFDVAIWHLFLLFPQWYLSFLPYGGSTRHNEIMTHFLTILFWWLRIALGNNLVFSYGCIINFAQFWFCFYGTPPCRLRQSLTLKRTGEFRHVARVLAPLAPTLAS
jgi:hypothetical protein